MWAIEHLHLSGVCLHPVHRSWPFSNEMCRGYPGHGHINPQCLCYQTRQIKTGYVNLLITIQLNDFIPDQTVLL